MTSSDTRPDNRRSPRRLLLGIVTTIAVFAASAGISWGITKDPSSSRSQTRQASTTAPAALTVDENGTPVAPETGSATPVLTPLPNARLAVADATLAKVRAVPMLGEDEGTPATDPTTATTAPTATDPDGADAAPTAAPTTSTTGSDDGVSGTAEPPGTGGPTTAPERPGGRELWSSPALRFLDPCADRPSRCAELAGATATGATVLPTAGGLNLGPVMINELWMSSAVSDGCSTTPVPQGHRAVFIRLTRPADLKFTWDRMGTPAGETMEVPLDPETVPPFLEAPGRGWSACIDVPFPESEDHSSATLTATATAEDGSRATRTTFSYDDDHRHLTILPRGQNEVVALTPSAGEIKMAGIKLRDGESEVAGCQRAGLRVLPRYPAPGTEAYLGERIPDSVAKDIAPGGGNWFGARFVELNEAERYAICLFSIGRSRGNLRGSLEATDAVLVRPPDRERYMVRPATFRVKSYFDFAIMRTRLGLDPTICRFPLETGSSSGDVQDLRSERGWCTIGALEAPEVLTIRTDGGRGKTADATITLPAHCTGPTSCARPETPWLVELDMPGSNYDPRACGAIGGSCGGLTPRGVLLGRLDLEVKRILSPVGPREWTIGANKRVSTTIPPEYYELIDFSRSKITLARDGTMTADIYTVVPTVANLFPMTCDWERRSLEMIPGDGVEATEHHFVFPERLEPRRCMTAGVQAYDPTGRLHDNTDGMLEPVWNGR